MGMSSILSCPMNLVQVQLMSSELPDYSMPVAKLHRAGWTVYRWSSSSCLKLSWIFSLRLLSLFLHNGGHDQNAWSGSIKR